MQAVDAGRFKLHFRRVLLRQGVSKRAHSPCQLAVFVDAQQNMGGYAPIGDEYRACQRCLFSLAGRLIKFAARHGYDSHTAPFIVCSYVTTFAWAAQGRIKQAGAISWPRSKPASLKIYGRLGARRDRPRGQSVAVLPHVESLLMDRATLMAHESVWGAELNPVTQPPQPHRTRNGRCLMNCATTGSARDCGWNRNGSLSAGYRRRWNVGRKPSEN